MALQVDEIFIDCVSVRTDDDASILFAIRQRAKAFDDAYRKLHLLFEILEQRRA